MEKKPEKFDLETLLKIPHKLRSTEDHAVIDFSDAMTRARILMDSVLVNNVSDETKLLAQHNFTVNLVTEIEVVCKRIVIEFRDKWKKNNYEKLVVEKKITYLEAFNLMNSINESKNKADVLTIEHLISEFNSFKNVESIGSTFSVLTGTDNFLTSLGNKKTKHIAGMPKSLTDFLPSWLADTKTLFNVRNQFVHESKLNDKVDFIALHEAGTQFAIGLYFYFFD